MLNKKVLSLINDQIWLENNASFYYLKLSIEFNDAGFGGISQFFLNQSNEERKHMIKLIMYVMEKDSCPSLPQYNFMEEKENNFNVLSHFETSLFNEREVTNSINKIISKCKEVGDYTTENFLQWFINEQREEENKFKEIIDNLKIIGDDGLGLYEINKELLKLSPINETMG
jgi:ferritin